MTTFSWVFECTKIQWLQIKKEILNGKTLFIYNCLCFALIFFKQPKRTRQSGARNVIREIPITICICKKSFSEGICKISGLAMFQPHQFFGLMFLIFVVCLAAQQGFAESVGISLLISVIHGIAITINEASSLSQMYFDIKQLF